MAFLFLALCLERFQWAWVLGSLTPNLLCSSGAFFPIGALTIHRWALLLRHVARTIMRTRSRATSGPHSAISARTGGFPIVVGAAFALLLLLWAVWLALDRRHRLFSDLGFDWTLWRLWACVGVGLCCFGLIDLGFSCVGLTWLIWAWLIWALALLLPFVWFYYWRLQAWFAGLIWFVVLVRWLMLCSNYLLILSEGLIVDAEEILICVGVWCTPQMLLS